MLGTGLCEEAGAIGRDMFAGLLFMQERGMTLTARPSCNGAKEFVGQFSIEAWPPKRLEVEKEITFEKKVTAAAGVKLCDRCLLGALLVICSVP